MSFSPTSEWQDVPPDAVLPPGCQIRLDMTSGRQQARLASNGHDPLDGLDREYAQDAGAPAVEPYQFTRLRDLRPDLECKFVVRDVVPRRALGEIYAPPGGGKTAISVDLGMHIAAAIAYRERRTERQPVIYIALEGHGGINNRVLAAGQHLGISTEDLPFVLIKISASFRVQETAQRVAATARSLLAEYGGDNPVIFVDTFQAALGAGGSDCRPEDVSELIENVKAELIGQGCTVIIVHHTGKDASRGARGWSGLLAALDFELEVDRDDDLRTLRVSKMRDGSDTQHGFCYRLEERFMGRNQYDEPVTTVVVRHLADEDSTKGGKRLSPKARAALNVLWELIKDGAQSWPIPDEPRLRCTMLGVWQKECVAPGRICRANTENDRAKKFRAAKQELEEAGAIVCDGENGERIYPTPKPKDGEPRGE